MSFEVEPSDTIKKLRIEIANKTGLPSGGLHLLLAGRLLEDLYTLSYYNIKNESVLHVPYRSRNINANQSVRTHNDQD
jgi:hypothetical protein